MALIPVHFTIAGFYPISNASANAAIQPGDLLTIVADGSGNPAVSGITSTASYVVGLAGDGFRTDVPTTATGYASDIVINSAGDISRSQNRISDSYKETLASGQMTVYSGVGTFRTNRFVASPTLTYAFSLPLYSSAAGVLTSDVNGVTNQILGRLTGLPVGFPSGVPGTNDALNGSMPINGGNFMTFTLNV